MPSSIRTSVTLPVILAGGDVPAGVQDGAGGSRRAGAHERAPHRRRRQGAHRQPDGHGGEHHHYRGDDDPATARARRLAVAVDAEFLQEL
jgi:hypothetical protein